MENFGWLDFSRLEGFSSVIEEVLTGNEQLPPWFAQAAGKQFELRVKYVRELVASR